MNVDRFNRTDERLSVEDLLERIGSATTERQALRDRGAAAEAIEANRIELARLQWELSYALIERYRPAA